MPRTLSQVKQLPCGTPLSCLARRLPCLWQLLGACCFPLTAIRSCYVKQNKWVKGFLLAVCWQLTGYAPVAYNWLIVHGLVGNGPFPTQIPQSFAYSAFGFSNGSSHNVPQHNVHISVHTFIDLCLCVCETVLVHGYVVFCVHVCVRVACLWASPCERKEQQRSRMEKNHIQNMWQRIRAYVQQQRQQQQQKQQYQQQQQQS